MRILVTGGAGFVGSHICEEVIAQGHEPFVLDDLSSGTPDNLPAGVPIHEADVRDKAAVEACFDEVKPHMVCHQAAQMSVSRSVREPVFDAEVNGIGMLHVLESCVKHDVQRVTFASSGGVLYGDVYEPAPEDTPANPISPYGITKFLGEQYLQFFGREHGLKSVALRYTNVYGPRQNPHGEAGVVAIFAQAMLKLKVPTIFGKGDCVRDYVFVHDVARANVAALFADLQDTFVPINISTEVGTDVNELAEGIRRCVKLSLAKRGGAAESVLAPTHGPDRAGDLMSNLASHKRAAELLNWSPQVALDEGLEMTVEWFAEKCLDTEQRMGA